MIEFWQITLYKGRRQQSPRSLPKSSPSGCFSYAIDNDNAKSANNIIITILPHLHHNGAEPVSMIIIAVAIASPHFPISAYLPAAAVAKTTTTY